MHAAMTKNNPYDPGFRCKNWPIPSAVTTLASAESELPNPTATPVIRLGSRSAGSVYRCVDMAW
jgi:hypothetical protein